MSRTITVTAISDAELKRQSGDESVYRVRCGRNRDLRFQFMGSDRSRGSWYLRHESRWQKFGEWPQIPTRAALELLQGARERLAGGSSVAVDRFVTVGDLLRWHRERVMQNRNLSDKRKRGVRSIIDVQLLPRIADLNISDINRGSLDEQLMWPLQSELAVSYVNLCMRVLRMAFTQATRLELLQSNPMEGMKLSDFVQTRIKPKPAALNMLDLPVLMERIVSEFESDITIGMMALMMLAHGTRIGETRQAMWRHICLQQKLWVIPAENTKTRSEHALPLTDRMCEVIKMYREALGGRYSSTGSLFLRSGTNRAITEGAAFSGMRRLSGGQWSGHDLRKLARTSWVELGVDYLIGEMLLNHSMSLAAETYVNTRADELKLDALSRWHEHLDKSGMSVIACGTEAV